jgi:hypothetical protein
MSADLVAPSNLNIEDEHSLAFVFGNNSQSEILKCGWNK